MPSTRVLVTTDDRIGSHMAGPGIRSVELARILATEHDVSLLTSDEIDDIGLPFSTGRYGSAAQLRQAVADSDVVIAFGTLLDRYPSVARTNGCVVADLYDPAILEALVRHAADPMPRQLQFHRGTLRALRAQLRRADMVLCASDRQRHLVLGMLTAVGRVNPATYDADPSLRGLVRVVPFGLPPAPTPVPRPGPIRTRYGLDKDDVVVLWGGGIHEWLDPVVLVEALAQIPDPHVKVVFMGTTHPAAAVATMPVVSRLVDRARDLQLIDRRVFFLDGWIPYDERIRYLLDADLGVSLHRDHIESEFSFRTRLLDYIWAGLPIVCTAGDTLSDVVRDRQLGDVVPVGDVTAIRQSIVRLSDPVARAQHRRPLAEAAQDFRWDRVAGPVVEFCRSPRRAPDSLTAYRKLRRRVENRERLHAAIQRVTRGQGSGSGDDEQC